MWLIAEGKTNKEIADELGISDGTTKYHVTHACSKFNTSSRTRAAVQFVLGQEPAVARGRLLR